MDISDLKNKRIGFFDVDCLELSADDQGFAYRPRVKTIVGQLEEIYQKAEKRKAPFLFTTCCSGNMPKPESFEDVLYVPLSSFENNWQKKVASYRKFYLAKRAYGVPGVNYACRAFDMFQDNMNARKLLEKLDVKLWVVFGNGFDLCVKSAVSGILNAGYEVIVIQDVFISSAGGNSQTEEKTRELLKQQGAQFITSAELLKKL